MISFIEIGFYISLAVMLCLLFLLINHLKSRIITLENQNEGMMDVMKMIRGNLVVSDKEQKQVKESIVSLAKNVSQVSNVVHAIQNKPVEQNNITLEVEDLSSVQGNTTNPWTAESEEDETEEGTQQIAEDNDLEVVNIDWPVDENIEIHKIITEDSTCYDDLHPIHETMEMRQMHMATPIFMHSTDASDIQKMFFMMSMGNGIPMSNIIFESHHREYQVLPQTFDDPDVEQLPESPVPELIDDIDEENNEHEKITAFDSQELHSRINDLITEITMESSSVVDVAIESEQPETPVAIESEQPETPVAIESEQPDTPVAIENEQMDAAPVAIENEPSDIPVAIESEQPDTPIAIENEQMEKEEKSMDFSKMDLRTLRSLVSTQGKVSNEKVSKMKKAELVRILSSSSSTE